MLVHNQESHDIASKDVGIGDNLDGNNNNIDVVNLVPVVNERTPVAVSRRTVQRKLHFFGYTRRSVRKKISIITVKKKRIAWCRGDI